MDSHNITMPQARYISWQMKKYKKMLPDGRKEVVTKSGETVKVDYTMANFEQWLLENLDKEQASEIIRYFKEGKDELALQWIARFGYNLMKIE